MPLCRHHLVRQCSARGLLPPFRGLSTGSGRPSSLSSRIGSRRPGLCPAPARSNLLPPCRLSPSRQPHRVFQTSSPTRRFGLGEHHQPRLGSTSSATSPSASPNQTLQLQQQPTLFSQLLRPRTGLLHRDAGMAAGQQQQQVRGHGGGWGKGHSHAHSHSHGHDNVYLTSSNKKDAGVRITRIGLYSNLGMAVVKGAGGYAFNSQSMIADAWHSLTDLASDILTLATVSYSLKPPTKNFPMGFGKVESLGSLGVSGMLLLGGVFMCWTSCQSLFAHFLMDPAAAAALLEHGHHHGHGHGHSHGHGHGVEGPSLRAAWLATGTIVVKEWLYHATMKVARERKSSVLASNAIHHRIDSLTGIVTLTVILGANFISNAAWLDPVGGLLISLMVIRGGWANTMAALFELADRSIDDEVSASVRRQAARALAGEPLRAADGATVLSEGGDDLSSHVELRDVSGVKSGQNYMVDIELAVPGGWTVEDARAAEDAVRLRVGARVRGVRRVRVRFVAREAACPAERFDEFVRGDASKRSSPEPEEKHEHEHGHDGHDDDHNHPKSK